MTRVTDELLEDSVFDIEDFIAQEFALRLGQAKKKPFWMEDGIGKPLGLLRQLNRVVVSENAGNITMDDVIDLQHPLSRATVKRCIPDER